MLRFDDVRIDICSVINGLTEWQYCPAKTFPVAHSPNSMGSFALRPAAVSFYSGILMGPIPDVNFHSWHINSG